MELVLTNEMKGAIALLDEVLTSFDQIRLLENPDFVINNELLLDYFIQFEIKRDTAHAKIVLMIIGGNIRIDIDRAEEAFEWSAEQTRTSKDEIVGCIKMLFFSKIKIERCGSNYTKLYFFDSDGKCVKDFKYVTGLYLKIGCKAQEYSPVYKTSNRNL